MKLVPFFLGLFLLPFTALAEPNCSNAYDRTSFYDFKDSCFKHDVCYSEAKLTGMTKKSCDDRFYSHMKASCRGRSFLCDGAARTYYLAVKALDKSVFDSAAKKGAKILAELKRLSGREQDEVLAVFKARASGQSLWTAKNDKCGSMSNDAKHKACKADRDLVRVPDMPMDFGMGNCNILGIRWKSGHRTGNAQIQAAKYGVSLADIKSSRRDPCEGL